MQVLLSFCIVCMNRIEHIKLTLEQNILENQLPGVEFVLLDYNSTDGLEEWVRCNMKEYLDNHILVYYKELHARKFHRTHSRNMVMKLAEGEIVCNLDADNYLGKGFASFVLDQFSRNRNIFLTSSYNQRDAIGRVCVMRKDFLSINGYNESFSGYGLEDIELYNRLQKNGLTQIYVDNSSFFRAISHTNKLRIENEFLYWKRNQLYISYISPFLSEFYFFSDEICRNGYLKNNYNFYFNDFEKKKKDLTQREISPIRRVTLEGDLLEGKYICVGNKIFFQKSILYIQSNDNAYEILSDHTRKYYKIVDESLVYSFIMKLSEAINYKKYELFQSQKKQANPNGFGKGYVRKNFNDCIINI